MVMRSKNKANIYLLCTLSGFEIGRSIIYLIDELGVQHGPLVMVALKRPALSWLAETSVYVCYWNLASDSGICFCWYLGAS